MKRKFFGGLFIALGIIICLIPLGWKLYVDYEQKQMMEELKNLISESKTLQTKEPLETLEPDVSVEAAYEELDFTETKEDVEDDNREDFLKYQNVIGMIEIPKIEIAFAVVEGTERNNIRAAIGHMKKTALIGENGNCVLAGHRGGIYGVFFKHIDRLINDDEVKLTDTKGNEYIYRVYDQFIVEPTDMSVIQGDEKESTLTLISCENDGKQRIIVKCKLK